MKFNRMLLFFLSALFILSFSSAAYAAELTSDIEAVSEETASEEHVCEDEPASEMPALTGIKGDADMDGRLTAADARIILRVSVGLDTADGEAFILCDYDEDTKVSAADARCVLRFSVGLDPFITPEELEAGERAKEEALFYAFVEASANAVSEGNIKAALTELTKTYPDRGIFRNANDKAEKYIVSRLKQAGFADSDIEIYASDWKGVRCADIAAALPSKTPDAPIFLVCAHYDCAEGAEGAVDNGSGVAAVLEAARVLRSLDYDFGAELRFAFFDGEEKGYIGAYRYLQAISDSEKERHSFILNVDMAGFSKLQPQKYLVVSTEPVCESWQWREARANFTSNCTDEAKELLGDLGEEKYYSAVAAGMHDLVPFRKAGMTGATLSWRQYEKYSSHGSDCGLASPYTIHTAEDTLENLDIPSVAGSARLVTAAVLLADKELKVI